MSSDLPLFTDGKDPGALRTIGEVAAALGIRQHVLRYWEEQFPMLRPLKRSGGRRYYRTEDIQLVSTIDRLVHREGYTLKGARQALTKGKGRGVEAEPAASIASMQASPGPADNREVVARLRSIRQQLASALDAD